MHAVYEQLEREGKIGPWVKNSEGQLVERPGYRAEYPKWVTDSSGVRRVVKDLKEEIAAVGNAPPSGLPDPLAAEREKVTDAQSALERERESLAAATSEMREQLAQVAAMKDEYAKMLAAAKMANSGDGNAKPAQVSSKK